MWAKVAGYLIKHTVYIRNVIVESMKGLIPTHVHNVWHLDHGNGMEEEIQEHEFKQIYSGSQNTWSWSRGYHTTMYLPSSGYYLLQTWNSEHNYTNFHFLSAKILCNVLQSKSLSTWWAMSDFGICTMIASYFLSHKPNHSRLFAMIINGKDVTKELKPFMSSIVLSNNLTAAALCDLYFSFIQKVDNKKHEENTVTLIDFDLVERVVKGDEYLFIINTK